jgi:hypothetical protein
MAWRFPKWRELDGYPVDVDSLNESIEAYLEETDGLLNEHNWTNEAVTVLSNVAPDAITQMRSLSVTVPSNLGQGSPSWDVTGPIPIAVFIASTNMDWFVISGLSTTVTTGSVNLWVMASFQQTGTQPMFLPKPEESVRSGSQYGIRIDGYVIWETVVGGADRSNDTNGEGFGGNQASLPVVIDAVLPVTEGQHLIEIVERTVRNNAFYTPNEYDYWLVLNRELIIVELY